MMARFFLLMIGFGLAVAGGVTVILYLNLIPIGHGMEEYIVFISGRSEFYIFLAGFLLIVISLALPLKRK